METFVHMIQFLVSKTGNLYYVAFYTKMFTNYLNFNALNITGLPSIHVIACQWPHIPFDYAAVCSSKFDFFHSKISFKM